MFEKLIREMKKLERPRTFSISMPLDEQGFFDRQCANRECRQCFKVKFDDWKDKVRDEQVFCPFCRHEADSTEWNTPAQTEHIKSAARAEMARLVQGAMRRGVQVSRPKEWNAGFFGVSLSLQFKPGRIPPVVVAQATEAMRQDFTCEACGCRYASVGASFFCPSCGHNSALTSFDTTLDTVEKTVASIAALEASITAALDADAAKNVVRQMLEDQFARLVGAFERVNESLFDKLQTASQFPRKGSVFQRLDDASALWLAASGKSYADFLTARELTSMKLSFQRRHVYSHRQGIVDQAYLDKSGDRAYSVDQRLVVRASDVTELVTLMRQLVSGLRGLAGR